MQSKPPAWLGTKSGKIAFLSTSIALTACLNLVMIPMPQPLAEYDLSPILIYTLGLILNPLSAGLIVAIAQGIGTSIKAYTMGWPLVFIPGAMGVRGLEASIISLVSRTKPPPARIGKVDVLSMVVGVVWETIAFTLADIALFGLGAGLLTLLTIVDAIFIPVAVVVVMLVRKLMGVSRIDLR